MLPDELRTALEGIGEGRSNRAIKTTAIELSEKYRFETGKGKVLLNTLPQAVAYALSRMPATYEAVSRVVSELNDEYNTLVDVGAGTGSATWAVVNRVNIDNITCIEREQAMIDIGKRLMSLSQIMQKVSWERLDAISGTIPRADLVVCAYMLGELSDEDRMKLVDKLWASTGKTLVIVEPGTPKHFRQIMEIKDRLISNGGYVASPCPVDKCPKLGTDDWCHFSVRVQRSKVHKLMKGGDAPYEDEKYTYLIVSRYPCEKAMNRVVRHPVFRPRVVELDLCTINGLSHEIITKSNPRYKAARDVDLGDEVDNLV